MDSVQHGIQAANTLLSHAPNLRDHLADTLSKFPDLPFGLPDIQKGQVPNLTDSLPAVAAVAVRDAFADLKKIRADFKDVADEVGRNLNGFLRGLSAVIEAQHPVDRRTVFKVTQNNVSPEFLNGLMKAEQVKSFTGWNDMETRLGATNPNRAIYACRDPYKDGALISIQTAFTQGMADNIGRTIRGEDSVEGKPDTATFYSISNWKRVGLPIGKPFILAVVDEIRAEHPQVKHFVTLSPMPGFRKWLSEVPAQTVHEIGATRVMKHSIDDVREAALSAKSLGELQKDPVYPDLQRLAAFYIANGTMENGQFRAFNEVANFHPKNGACFERLLPGADESEQGFKNSFGFMVNYKYGLDNLDANAKTFQQGRMARSASVQRLMSETANPIAPKPTATPR